MTVFYVGCLALILLCGLFFIVPRAARRSAVEDLAESNREWYRLRQEELAREGAQSLEEDARLRLLEDDHQSSPAPQLTASQSAFTAWWLLPLVAVAAGALYYALGGARDVIIARELQALDGDTTPAQMRQLITAIEGRAQQRPDNLSYMGLLGRYYMGQGDYASALASYDALVEAVPEDAQALAFAAQAEYLAADRTLSDAARLRAEQALAAEPHERTALGLLGMASFEAGQYRAAIGYWERLLAMEPPGSESAQMIAGVLERARAALEGAATPASQAVVAAPVAAKAVAGSAGVTVTVQLPQGAEVAPGDTLFVLARNAAANSRMPIAVQRLSAGQLPVTIRLDDSRSMAGQKISEAESVIVVAQISRDGRPGAANASWLVESGPVAPSAAGGAAIEVMLAPNQP